VAPKQAGEHFLIVRIAGIGDVVMASTAVRRLHDERPAARVTWLCGSVAAPLVRDLVGVNDVIAVDEHRLLRGGALDRASVLAPLWRQLLSRGITHVLMLHADRRYRMLVAPLVGARLLTLNPRNDDRRMNPIPGRYMGDEYARLIDGLGHEGPVIGHHPLAELRTASVVPSPAAGRPRIALVPGGAKNVLRESALRRWPVGHYVALAKALVDDDCEILLVGDAGDTWVRAEFAGLAVTDVIGQHALPATASLLVSCDLVVSHDTGPMHLARLVRAPLLALFGPTMPAQFVVEDATTTVLWGGGHLACRPCYDGRELANCSDNVCMSSIGSDVVLSAARAILAKRPPIRAAIPH
jgi:heptosyltransferase-2